MPLCYATISMADANKEGDVNAADVVEVGKLTGKTIKLNSNTQYEDFYGLIWILHKKVIYLHP